MISWDRTAERLARVRPGGVLLLLVALQFGLHARWLDLPPSGFHAWRQTQVLSVARNYHDESMNFFEPRVDSRGRWTGITGLEFPLSYYTMALGYRAFGVHPWVARVTMLLFSLVGVLGAYRLGRVLFGTPGWGLVAAAMLIVDPLFGYYSFAAGPDVPMLGFLLLGLAACVEWSRAPASASLLGGVAALSLAALLKLSSVAAWPAVAVLLARGLAPSPPRERVRALAVAAAGILPIVAWYAWARHLSAAYHNSDFLLATKLPYSLALVPGVARKVLLQWLPEVYVSYPQFALALVGLVALRRPEARGRGTLVAAYGAGLLVYSAAVLPMLDMHDYFMMPIVAPLLVLVLEGARRLAHGSRSTPLARWALDLLLLACAIVGPWRALSRLDRSHPRADLLAMETRLPAIIPDRNALIVAASDRSPSIYLYYMHRKGWSVMEDVNADSLRSMAAQGARYLVSDSRALEARPEVRPHLAPAGSVGEFNVFRLGY